MANLEMIHLDPAELLDYFDGTLNEERVRQHLDACRRCRSKLKNLALTRIMISPPSAALSKYHIPPETLAEYEEDKLGVEQNRAVEEHFTQCRRCLIDYVSLKLALGGSLDDEPSDGLARQILDNLDNYRRVKPLGTMHVKPFREAVSVDYKPAPDPEDLGHYSEDAAKYLYSFRPEPERMMRMEEPMMEEALEAVSMEVTADHQMDYAAGDVLHRRTIDEPISRLVPTDNNLIRVSVGTEDSRHTLVVEVLDNEGAVAQSGIQVTLEPATDTLVSKQTDHLGLVRFDLPQGPSLIRIHLEKVYELDLRSLL